MLERIWGAISSVPNKIQELVTFVGTFFSNLGNLLGDVVEGIGEFLTELIEATGDILTYLGENLGDFFSDLGTSIGGFFSNLTTALGGWFIDLGDDLGNWFSDLFDNFTELLDWTGDFFDNMLDFFLHIFVPTESQWEAIEQDYQDVGDSFRNHLPFVTLFSTEMENAKQVVYNEDFLNIHFDSWNFDLGVIHYQTSEINFTGVLDNYEPYRMTIRTALSLIVYALGLVYVIKLFIRHGQTSGESSPLD